MVVGTDAETVLFNRWYVYHWWYTKSAAILSLLHYSVLKTLIEKPKLVLNILK